MQAKFHLIALAALLPTGLHAQEEVAPRSVLYQGQSSGYSELTTLPENQLEKDQGAPCMELLEQTDALKGRPQRRSAAMARYEAECRRRLGDRSHAADSVS
jgi:hypothetical protein